MENATNALMIAGGVLIGIMLLSIIVIAFQGAADLAKSYDTNIEGISLSTFNNHFDKYATSEVNVETIISLAYFVNHYNSSNGYEPGDSTYISMTVECPKKIELDKLSNDEILNLLRKDDSMIFESVDSGKKIGKDESTELQKYRCKDIKYEGPGGKVSEIVFKKL